MSKLRFVGLDVHKDTIVIAVAEEGQAVPSVLGTFPHDVAKVVKQLGKLVSEVSLLRVCYEAGPTGFGLCRRLQAAGMECVVVAPSLVPQQAGARVKTDRRDAARLAHFLRSGDLTAVWVPDEQTEALRDLERSRDVSLRQNQSREETLKREESLKEKSPSHTSSKGERLPSRRRYDHQKDARPHPSGLRAGFTSSEKRPPVESGTSATDQVMRFRPANISLINSRSPRRRLGSRTNPMN